MFAGQTVTLTDTIIGSVFLNPGGTFIGTNVRVNGSVVVLPQVGAAVTKLHLINSAVHAGITVNVIDAGGNLYWGGEVPVDVLVQDSWIFHPQGDGQYHTEALAGFGWPRGARFERSSFIQGGPFNSTATGAINWHGADSVFTGCLFGYSAGIAAYYTVYVEGRNNTVSGSAIEAGLATYVYPSSNPQGIFVGNVDAVTGNSVTP